MFTKNLGKSERTIRGKVKVKRRITRRYLAGLLDGEGYFGITAQNIKNRSYFSPAIKMALTEKDAYLLKEVCSMLGGYIYKRIFKNNNHNDAYCWEVKNHPQVKRVLDYVHPYLILKKGQADVLRKLAKTKKNKFGKIEPEVLEKRRSLYALIRKLNSRGRPPAETKRERPEGQGKVIVRTSEKSEEVNRNVSPASELVAVT